MIVALQIFNVDRPLSFISYSAQEIALLWGREVVFVFFFHYKSNNHISLPRVTKGAGEDG